MSTHDDSALILARRRFFLSNVYLVSAKVFKCKFHVLCRIGRSHLKLTSAEEKEKDRDNAGGRYSKQVSRSLLDCSGVALATAAGPNNENKLMAKETALAAAHASWQDEHQSHASGGGRQRRQEDETASGRAKERAHRVRIEGQRLRGKVERRRRAPARPRL